MQHQKKSRYTSTEKTMILREYLENHVPISELAETYNIHVNAIYKWKKQLFESAPSSLSKLKKSSNKSDLSSKKRIKELETLLSGRESLIAELVEDNISLKKKNLGKISIKSGLR